MDARIQRSAAMGAVFGLGGMLLMPVLVLTGAPLIASAQSFVVAAYMALVPMFLGYLLFGFGLARIPASTDTTVTLLEPGVATLLAVVIVGERLAVVGWMGMAAIAASLVMLSLPARAGDPGDRSAPMP
jgi:DME family drug/metabolite transporter